MKNILNSKIFLVDDDHFIGKYYNKFLSNLEFTNLRNFYCSVDFINAIDENPEVILLDHQMDHISGFETLKKIKRFNPNAFVIMVSSQKDMTIAVDSLKFGAFDYIIKGEGDTKQIEDALKRISIIKERIHSKEKSIFKRISPFG